MKAYIYDGIHNGTSFICAAFQNTKEFVNIFYEKQGIYQILLHQGEVYYDAKMQDIKAKVIADFSATNIEQSFFEVGNIIKHVWRPGLCVDIEKALEVDKGEQQRAIKSLKILTERLDDILMYIEPDSTSLQSYGHKTRELLILACTEVESFWQFYLKQANIVKPRPTTNDYVKLHHGLFLEDYKLSLNSYPFIVSYKPFAGWDINRPTQSLDWYDAYNETKHDMYTNFSKATLEKCIKAVMAAITLFCVRYSPYSITEERGISAKTVAELFTIEVIPTSKNTIYIPAIKSIQMASGAFSAPLASGFETFWSSTPLQL